MFSGFCLVWDKVGVIFIDDVVVFENVKLCILNGMYLILVYVGMLVGKEMVFEVISDDMLYVFICKLLISEIMLFIDVEGVMDLVSYVDDIVCCYQNCYICYLLL